MLAEKYRQLLTAYVDGELSARQRRHVQKLLRKSPEARDLLRHLQADSDALIQLPTPPSSPDFSLSVMQVIAQRGLQPGSKSAPRSTQSISIWTAVAAAAAVLFVVGGASYFIVSALSASDPSRAIVNKHKDDVEKNAGDKVAPESPPRSDVVKKPDGQDKLPRRDPAKDVVKDNGNKPEKKVPPDEKPDQPDPGPIFTAPSMEVFQPNSAEVAVPFLLKLRDLETASSREALTSELGRSDAFYVELLCREATHAFPRVQSALQSAGFELLVDRTVQTYLKQPQFRGPYGLYLEDVTAEEFVKLLRPLGVDDSRGDRKKPATGQFLSNDANLILCTMNAEHRKRLTNLIGVELRQSRSNGPRGVDLTRPLSDQTAEEVLDALGEPRVTSNAGKKSERLALAFPYLPGVKNPPSPELKRFLEARKPARKGTVQVLIVLRGRP